MLFSFCTTYTGCMSYIMPENISHFCTVYYMQTCTELGHMFWQLYAAISNTLAWDHAAACQLELKLNINSGKLHLYRQAWLALLHFNKVHHPRWHAFVQHATKLTMPETLWKQYSWGLIGSCTADIRWDTDSTCWHLQVGVLSILVIECQDLWTLVYVFVPCLFSFHGNHAYSRVSFIYASKVSPDL